VTVETPEQHEALVSALMDPERWPAGGRDRRRIDTHISTVVLAGDRAYKLKKPLDLGFLDFVALAARRAACDEELRLNRRLAPRLYLSVLPVTGSIGAPAFGGEGDAIDWAVEMRRFDPDAILSLRSDRLDTAMVERLATRIAGFHADAARCPLDSPFGTPAVVRQPVDQNFAQVREHVGAAVPGLDAVECWSADAFAGLQETMAARRADGHVREGHGDLHLGNIALIDGEAVVFDAIEFNPAFRFIDTINDIAFLYMDLQHRGMQGLANRFVDRYLGETGDYAGLALLRFYAVYRAMVRAKIAAIRLGQDLDADERSAVDAELRAYVALAGALARSRAGAVVITHGVSGSGKSHATATFADCLPAVRLRSDVERKRLLGQRASADVTALGGYSAELTERTYARLLTLAGSVARAGHVAVVDATFLQRAQRDRFRDLAARLGVPFALVDCDAPVAVLRERILARRRQQGNVSDADLGVLDAQLARREPLSERERELSLAVRPGEAVAAAALRARLGIGGG
jgi:aminoglycoside phosphotransferase family enzyme/predicted kinase